MIKRGGEKIAPPHAVETILLSHPAVQDALVFPVPDPKYALARAELGACPRTVTSRPSPSG